MYRNNDIYKRTCLSIVIDISCNALYGTCMYIFYVEPHDIETKMDCNYIWQSKQIFVYQK